MTLALVAVGCFALGCVTVVGLALCVMSTRCEDEMHDALGSAREQWAGNEYTTSDAVRAQQYLRTQQHHT
jgi:hypothetical protein